MLFNSIEFNESNLYIILDDIINDTYITEITDYCEEIKLFIKKVLNENKIVNLNELFNKGDYSQKKSKFLINILTVKNELISKNDQTSGLIEIDYKKIDKKYVKDLFEATLYNYGFYKNNIEIEIIKEIKNIYPKETIIKKIKEFEEKQHLKSNLKLQIKIIEELDFSFEEIVDIFMLDKLKIEEIEKMFIFTKKEYIKLFEEYKIKRKNSINKVYNMDMYKIYDKTLKKINSNFGYENIIKELIVCSDKIIYADSNYENENSINYINFDLSKFDYSKKNRINDLIGEIKEKLGARINNKDILVPFISILNPRLFTQNPIFEKENKEILLNLEKDFKKYLDELIKTNPNKKIILVELLTKDINHYTLNENWEIVDDKFKIKEYKKDELLIDNKYNLLEYIKNINLVDDKNIFSIQDKEYLVRESIGLYNDKSFAGEYNLFSLKDKLDLMIKFTFNFDGTCINLFENNIYNLIKLILNNKKEFKELLKQNKEYVEMLKNTEFSEILSDIKLENLSKEDIDETLNIFFEYNLVEFIKIMFKTMLRYRNPLNINELLLLISKYTKNLSEEDRSDFFKLYIYKIIRTLGEEDNKEIIDFQKIINGIKELNIKLVLEDDFINFVYRKTNDVISKDAKDFINQLILLGDIRNKKDVIVDKLSSIEIIDKELVLDSQMNEYYEYLDLIFKDNKKDIYLFIKKDNELNIVLDDLISNNFIEKYYSQKHQQFIELNDLKYQIIKELDANKIDKSETINKIEKIKELESKYNKQISNWFNDINIKIMIFLYSIKNIDLFSEKISLTIDDFDKNTYDKLIKLYQKDINEYTKEDFLYLKYIFNSKDDKGKWILSSFIYKIDIKDNYLLKEIDKKLMSDIDSIENNETNDVKLIDLEKYKKLEFFVAQFFDKKIIDLTEEEKKVILDIIFFTDFDKSKIENLIMEFKKLNLNLNELHYYNLEIIRKEQNYEEYANYLKVIINYQNKLSIDEKLSIEKIIYGIKELQTKLENYKNQKHSLWHEILKVQENNFDSEEMKEDLIYSLKSASKFTKTNQTVASLESSFSTSTLEKLNEFNKQLKITKNELKNSEFFYFKNLYEFKDEIYLYEFIPPTDYRTFGQGYSCLSCLKPTGAAANMFDKICKNPKDWGTDLITKVDLKKSSQEYLKIKTLIQRYNEEYLNNGYTDKLQKYEKEIKILIYIYGVIQGAGISVKLGNQKIIDNFETPLKTIVDNVRINKINNNIIQILKDANLIQLEYSKMEFKEKGVKFVTIGSGYSDIKLSKFEKIIPSYYKYIQELEDCYTDARKNQQYLVCSKDDKSLDRIYEDIKEDLNLSEEEKNKNKENIEKKIKKILKLDEIQQNEKKVIFN